MISTTVLLVVASTHAPPPPYAAEISAATADVERVHAVPEPLVRAVIQQESSFNPRAYSKSGAIGLMQVMPFNAPLVGLRERDLWDPAKNILAGVRLLAVLLKYYRGDVISVLVAYNAGPRRPFAPIPRNGETPAYVARVLGFFREYRKVRPMLEAIRR